MLAYVNGAFLPQNDATLPILDRSFLYGDALFETLPVYNGSPFAFELHFARLRQSAEFLKIPSPPPANQLLDCIRQLLQRNSQSNCILRIQLSRGIGQRGYSPRGANNPSLTITLHPSAAHPPSSTPDPLRLATCPWRVSASDPLLQHKTCSKAFHVLARADAENRGFDDALLLNHRDEITETTCSNLFWIAHGVVHTPPISAGLLPGITRQLLLELCRTRGLAACQTTADLNTIRRAEAVFVTLSSSGIVPVSTIDDHSFPLSPVFLQLHRDYAQASHTSAE